VAEARNGLGERTRRWRRFLSMDGGPTHLFRVNYTPDDLPPPPPWPGRQAERVEWAWRTHERHLARTEWLEDDSLPCLYVRTGTEIFAEAFGCSVYRPEGDMPFALPAVHNAQEAARLRVPELGDSSLAQLFEMADELWQRAGGGALMKLPDVQSPMDIASLIWDKNSFYVALVEEPAAATELAAKVNELLTAFLDEWFARYGREYVAHYPDYYMHGGLTLSEDEIGAVSGEVFEELFLPELVELSERYGGIGVHCCADARHQWEGLKRVPGLRLLNLVQPEDELRDAFMFFADHVPQMHSWSGDGPPWTWPEQHPPGARVVMETWAHGRDEALRMSEKLRAACGGA
jgi:hypothetical protein